MKIVITKSGQWAVRSKGIFNFEAGQEVELPPYDAAELLAAGRAEIFKKKEKETSVTVEDVQEGSSDSEYTIEKKRQGWWVVNGVSVRGTDEETAIANYESKMAE